MAPFCAKRYGASGADGDVLAGVIAQPLHGPRRVLLARMEIAPFVFAPRSVGFANEPAPAEEERSRALPGAPLPQRAVAAQVGEGLAQRVGQEDRRHALEPGDAPLVAAFERLVHVERGALVFGLF